MKKEKKKTIDVKLTNADLNVIINGLSLLLEVHPPVAKRGKSLLWGNNMSVTAGKIYKAMQTKAERWQKKLEDQ